MRINNSCINKYKNRVGSRGRREAVSCSSLQFPLSLLLIPDSDQDSRDTATITDFDMLKICLKILHKFCDFYKILNN